MKRKPRYLIIYVLLAIGTNVYAQTVSHDFRDTLLAEALTAIRDAQQEYTFHFIHDDLDGLTVTTRVKNLSVTNAVKRVCKGLPVKVKIKDNRIYVQAKDKTRPDSVLLSGKVEDGFLKMPLADACISILTTDSAMVADSVKIIRFINGRGELSMAHYGAKVSGRHAEYLVRAQLDGYDEAWQRVRLGARQEEVEVPTLQMRKSTAVTMREVLVTATKVKFYWHGDTLIYDATAFNLPQGSMLGDLIRQMPGVTMNDAGEIFVNGRKVDELLLGSRSFFGGNKKVLMENLPYYTVKNLKVYEKQSDRSEALGYDVDPRRYVMDVNLKDEYSRGYIANVEAAGGTDKRWLARGFMLGFTKQLRTTLLANANNVNEYRHIGETGHWTPGMMPQSLLTTRSVATEIDYQPKNKKMSETLRAEYSSTTDKENVRQRRERFLEGRTPTSLSEALVRQGTQRLNVNNTFKWNKPWAYVTADLHYTHRDGSSSDVFEQWDDTLTTAMRATATNKGTTWNASVDGQGTFNVGNRPKQHIFYYARVEHNSEETEDATRWNQTLPSSLRHNARDVHNHNTWGGATFTYHKDFGPGLHWSAGDGAFLTVNRDHDWLYHPDTLLLPSQLDVLTAITDPSNSYDLHRRRWEHKPGVGLSKNSSYVHPDFHMAIGYQRWAVNMGVPVIHERLGYQRGAIDTLARQTTLILEPRAEFRHMWKDGRRDLHLRLHYSNAPANLLDRIDWRDDSHPLVVKLGNPDLKGTSKTSFEADYFDRTGPRQGMYYLATSFNYYHRSVGQSSTYDPLTGTYTYKPMNISGAYRAHADFSTDRNIGQQRYWTWHVNASADWDHAKDHAMLAGETMSHVNTVNTLMLKTTGRIQYSKGKFNIRASGEVQWRHSEGQMRDFDILNAFDYEYGITARYTTPTYWKWTGEGLSLSVDATMYSRRGYGSNELNTDDFLLNASLSQPLLKGKIILRIEAFDLLHQLSNTQYIVDAQGRTETWYRSLPRYVMLHLVYHWNRNPKK